MPNPIRKVLLRLLRWPGQLRDRLEKQAARERFAHIGRGFIFDPAMSVFSSGDIKVGDYVFIGKGAYIAGDVSIGNRVMFGANPTVLAGDHIFAVRGKSPRFIKPYPGQNNRPVVIEDEVWVGANVTILSGVTVGMGAVVGAGSVVIHSVPPFTVAVGNPCRPVRRIFDDETLFRHLIEIGYEEKLAREVVQRRQSLLQGLGLPAIDHTDRYGEVIYEPPRGR